jgi:hypothetical protein
MTTIDSSPADVPDWASGYTAAPFSSRLPMCRPAIRHLIMMQASDISGTVATRKSNVPAKSEERAQ